MSEGEQIIRIAAKGDGVTSDGRHIAGAVPGDTVAANGEVAQGSEHVDPACQHFGVCGGCQLQHASDDVLRQFVQDRVVNAAQGQGMEAVEILPTHLSPPRSRRRATLHAMRTKSGAVLGFREAGSHRLVDIAQCAILRPELMTKVEPLREFVAQHGPRGSVDVALAICDQGVDVGLANFPLEGLGPTEGALEFARHHNLARLTIDQGYGAETVWEPEPVTISLSGQPVSMPAGAFLQATEDAEEQMARDAIDWLNDGRIVADLFAGLGTFAFALEAASVQGRKVLAVEADRAASMACKAAGAQRSGRVLSLHRDLFRNPLQPAELAKFDAVVLDPPRAGARSQIAEIAQSQLNRVVYISCNPSSWARDGKVLVDAGFELAQLRPVGQFRWSTHVELVSLFER